jgi:type VI secretion system protein VasD
MLLALAAACSACASPAGGDGLIGKTLETLGLKAPQSAEEVKASIPRDRKVTLRVHAGEQLNIDPQTRSLSVVVRVYRLRRLDAFLTAPYAAFGDAGAEKEKFGDDVIASRELVLRPGEKHEVVETLPLDVGYMAVVALFRSPSEGRWRFAFDARQAEKSGITLGLHGCGMSVAAGTPERAPPETLRVAGVRCD